MVSKSNNITMYQLHYWSHFIRQNELGGNVTCMGQRRFSHRILAGKKLRRPRHRWEGTIKINVKKISLEVVD